MTYLVAKTDPRRNRRATRRLIFRGKPASNHNNARKTHCPAGHELTPENTGLTLLWDGQRRYCRTCKRIRSREAMRRWRSRTAHPQNTEDAR